MVRKMILTITSAMLFATPAIAADLTLSELQVKKTLKAGKPYTVKLPYTKSGGVTVVEGCFLWSGEGPYCFPVDVRSKTIRAKLRTNNPNQYKLEGFVKYKSGGQTKSSNRVFAIIDVRS